MIKAFKYFLPLLSVPLVIACGSNSNKSNNPTTIKRGAGVNDECVVSVRCQNSSVSLTGTGTDWTHTLDQTVTTGSPCSFFFRANLGYNLPSDIFSIEKKEGGGKITEYTYAAVDEKVNKLTFTPTEDVYVNVVADTTCVAATINATNGVTAGFKYNGSLTYVDWGDGTVNQEVSHTYSVTKECVITIAGNVSSVGFGDNNPTANAYSGNANISKISLRNTIKYIPTGAFSNLTGLTGISIPQTVTKIAPRSFSGCNNLVNITLDDNAKYKTFNHNDIVDNSTHTLLFANSNASIDSSVTSIGEYAYENSDLADLAIPSTITNIGAFAFNNCTDLKSLDMMSYTTPPTLGDNAFNGCELESVDVKNSDVANAFEADPKWGPIVAEVELLTPADKCFTITALEDNTKISLVPVQRTDYPTAVSGVWLEWSKNNGETWTQSAEYTTSTIDLGTLNAGEKMEIRNPDTEYPNPSFAGFTYDESDNFVVGSCWTLSVKSSITADELKPFDVSNNIMSLIYHDADEDSVYPSDNYAFANLFGSFVTYKDLSTYELTETQASKVVDASNLYLPKDVRNVCYDGMFRKCESLVGAPDLPATTSYRYCYHEMFLNCTSLTRAPKILLENFNWYSCYSMFEGCSELLEAPNLLATGACPGGTLDHSCQNMFKSCTKMTKAYNLPIQSTAANCCASMFENCTSLTTAPTMQKEFGVFETYCFYNMFENCTNLKNNIPTKFVGELKKYCFNSMFAYCSAITNAPKLPPLYDDCGSGCYNSMFQECTALQELLTTTQSDTTLEIVSIHTTKVPIALAKSMFAPKITLCQTNTTYYYEPLV